MQPKPSVESLVVIGQDRVVLGILSKWFIMVLNMVICS
ncbi:unnamed protein product [Trichobilharzia regenti]|nr:unnamed protein product [Trichobilharzia regenti]